MMIERKNSGTTASKKIGDYIVLIQIILIMLSGLFVMHIHHSAVIAELEQRIATSPPPHNLRHTSTAVVSHLDYHRKRAVVDDLQKLYEGDVLKKADVQEILKAGKELLARVDSIYDISLPKIGLEEDAETSKKGITIVGDIHGEFRNMIHLFKLNGFPSLERPYIFNGDFTDRGDQSLQCLLGLLLIKLYCNECIYLHIGNHETLSFYNTTLRDQTIEMYDEGTFELVREVLVQLPLGAVVDDRIFVVHGGIPMKGFDLNDLRHYKRGNDPNYQTKEGYLFGRSVWADPDDFLGEGDDDMTQDEAAQAKAERIAKYDFEIEEENDDGRGWYTLKTTNNFLEKNHLEYVVRAHQDVSPGFHYHHRGRVITIHSFPEKATMSGAYLNIYSSDRSMHIEQFAGVKHSSMNHQSKIDWRALLY